MADIFKVGLSKTYSDGDDTIISAIRQTSDGGYVATGETYTYGAGMSDIWVAKLNSDMTAAWQKAYGGVDDDISNAVQQTSDGGFIVAGETYSSGAGNNDMLVMKLNSKGKVEWQETLGNSGSDSAGAVQQTSDGGVIVAGYTSAGSSSDMWVLKLNSDGSVAWQKAYGGSGYEAANAVQQTSDGGFIVAGEAYASGTGADYLLLRLDSSGNVVWQKTYDNSYYDSANAVQQTSDGGFIVAGYTSAGSSSDMWVLKLNSDGSVAWQKAYGGADNEVANAVQQTSDGGFIVAGYTGSFGAGDMDAWLIKLNGDGSVAWQKAYGGAGTDTANAILQAADGGYIFGGYSSSFGAGSLDAWIVKLSSSGVGLSMGIDTSAGAPDTGATVTAAPFPVRSTNVVPAIPSMTVTDTNTTINTQTS